MMQSKSPAAPELICISLPRLLTHCRPTHSSGAWNPARNVPISWSLLRFPHRRGRGLSHQLLCDINSSCFSLVPVRSCLNMGQAIERQSVPAGSPGYCSLRSHRARSVPCCWRAGDILTNEQLCIGGHNLRLQIKKP